MASRSGWHWRRIPLLLGGVVFLLLGLWGGVVRIGWFFPGFSAVTAGLHGPLMINGFLGTIIALERAVALDRWWGYLAPLAVLTGSIVLFLGWTSSGGMLIVVGGLVLAAIFVQFLRQQHEVFLGLIAGAIGVWIVGNVYWLMGAPLVRVVPYWMGFLVLTIAGERLELSRIRMVGRRPQTEFLGVTCLYVLGLALCGGWPVFGGRIMGGGLIAIGGWLMVRDIAWANLQRAGLPRYIGVALLTGYVWLPVSGAVFLWEGGLPAGFRYDAALHGVFVGFVMAMIFAHAPIIFPSVLGVDLVWTRGLYVPLALLHLGMGARIVGDLAPMMTLRCWGGLLGAVAIVLYFLTLGGATVARRVWAFYT